MEWYQVLTIVAANLGLFLWSVRQSRTDFLHVCRIIDSIETEMRDFHTKLALQDQQFKFHMMHHHKEIKPKDE